MHYFHNNKKGDIFSNVYWNDIEINVWCSILV